jgi:hypothetical protein
VLNQAMLKEWRSSAIFLLLAMACTAVVLLWVNDKATVESIWEIVIKLVTFALALLAIANIPAHQFKAPWSMLLVFLNFMAIFCFFIPRLFFYYWEQNWDGYYLTSQALVPFIILSLGFAFRIGGARVKDVLVFGAVAIVVMLSGIEDLMYVLINPHTDPRFTTIPDEFWWAAHMTVRAGKVLSKYEAFAFIAVHWVVAGLILYFSYFRKQKPAGKPGLSRTDLTSVRAGERPATEGRAGN